MVFIIHFEKYLIRIQEICTCILIIVDEFNIQLDSFDSSLIIISYCSYLFVAVTLHVQTLLGLTKRFSIEFLWKMFFLHVWDTYLISFNNIFFYYLLIFNVKFSYSFVLLLLELWVIFLQEIFVKKIGSLTVSPRLSAI